MRKHLFALLCLCFVCLGLMANRRGNRPSGPIDRKAVVSRHNPHIISLDTLGSLTVGNGHFAFTVDATGLQTFPIYYSNGMPLGTMSDWGWHSFPNTQNYKPEEAWAEKDFGRGHTELYACEFRTPGRQHDAANYLRVNPHRLHLGCVGLNLKSPEKLSDIDQHLDLWNGIIDSRFKYDGKPYHVQTTCSPTADKIAAKVSTKGIVEIVFRVPYPTGRHSDDACDWSLDGKQTINLEKHPNHAWLNVRIDQTTYRVRIDWKGKADVRLADRHTVILKGKDNMEFTVEFRDGYAVDASGQPIKVRRQEHWQEPAVLQSFEEVKTASQHYWNGYWKDGGIVDFSHVTDPRAAELERRVVLSQYLLAVNDAGDTPPQETGLTYNSWFGKFHLEMIWWHQAQFALWGHPELLERSLDWYFQAAPLARSIAGRQGFDGLRWMKMTDPNGGEAPSNVGSFLIWQQPHIIYLAELLYRCQKDNAGRRRITEKYKGLVDETAQFMCSFASLDSTGRFVLKGCIPAQETLKADSTLNPPLELSYWHWALLTAQTWQERVGEPRKTKWDAVLTNLSALAYDADSLYLAAESATDTYSDIRYTSDHPAVLGAVGMLPQSSLADDDIMRHTLEWVMKNWNWDKTWGWDYPMVAMCAARLGCPDKAVGALLMPCRTNTYLVNGHNYQDQRLRVYLPGNGGLLTAVAMMLAGWDGSQAHNPGFPPDWDIRWENLLPMP